MRAERDRLAVELEMLRYSQELVGKEPGADPDNLTNSEKTRVVVHLAAVFGLRHSDLLERVGIARSTFYHNLKQLDRSGRDEWLLEPCLCSMFLKQFGRYFSAVGAAGFPQCWQCVWTGGLNEEGIGPPDLYIPEL